MSDTPPHESEIRKNDAQARKFEAEERLHDAETREKVAEAIIAECDVETSQFELERQREKRERERSDFRQRRIYNFTDRVSADSTTKCIKELNYWHTADPGCDIELVFDSPGGSVFDGLNLFDFIKELRRDGHHVTTHTRGMAASMAGILLQAGDKRTMSAESWLLIHEISTVIGGKIGELEDEVALVHKIQERVLDIFAARSSLSKITLRRKWRRRDWWLDSVEALKLGLVDEVR